MHDLGHHGSIYRVLIATASKYPPQCLPRALSPEPGEDEQLSHTQVDPAQRLPALNAAWPRPKRKLENLLMGKPKSHRMLIFYHPAD